MSGLGIVVSAQSPESPLHFEYRLSVKGGMAAEEAQRRLFALESARREGHRPDVPGSPVVDPTASWLAEGDNTQYILLVLSEACGPDGSLPRAAALTLLRSQFCDFLPTDDAVEDVIEILLNGNLLDTVVDADGKIIRLAPSAFEVLELPVPPGVTSAYEEEPYVGALRSLRSVAREGRAAEARRSALDTELASVRALLERERGLHAVTLAVLSGPKGDAPERLKALDDLLKLDGSLTRAADHPASSSEDGSLRRVSRPSHFVATLTSTSRLLNDTRQVLAARISVKDLEKHVHDLELREQALVADRAQLMTILERPDVLLALHQLDQIEQLLGMSARLSLESPRTAASAPSDAARVPVITERSPQMLLATPPPQPQHVPSDGHAVS